MRTQSRSSKTIVILLAAIVALLWHGTRTQRRIMRRLTAFGVLYPGQGAVDTIGGWFGGIGGTVKDYVTRVVQAVADALQAGIDWVLSVAYGAANLAWNLYNNVHDFVVAIVNDVRRYAADVYWAAIGWAQSAVGAVHDFATSLWNSAIAFARDVYNQAIDWAGRAVGAAREFASSLWQNAVDLASSLFHQALDWASTVAGAVKDFAVSAFHQAVDIASGVLNQALDYAHTISSWALDTASTLAHDLVDRAHDAFNTTIDLVRNELGDAIATANDYLFSTVQTIIDAVITVLDWVVALAEFPFTTARDLWAAMRTTGGGTIRDHMPGMVDRWGGHIADHARHNATAQDKGYQLAPLPDHAFGGGGGGGGGGNTQGSGTPDRAAFAAGLLAALGAPATDSNLRFLAAWMAHENTRASYNPLATSLAYGQGWTNFNDIGVKNYPDLWTGTGATAQTIIGSGYPTLLAALRAGDGHAAGQAHADLSRWSGGGYDTIAA